MTEKLHLNNENVEKYFCFTKTNTIQLSYEWKIYDFSIINKENGESLKSPEFSSSANENIKCYIQLYPRGDKEEAKDYLSVYFHVTFEKSSKLEANLIFSLLDKCGKKIYNRKTNHIFTKPSGFGFTNYLTRDLLNRSYLINDCLTIVCDISRFESCDIT